MVKDITVGVGEAPFAWVGGKDAMLPYLLSILPPPDRYETYFEMFGGSGKLLFAKQPSQVEVFNDINADVLNVFRVLQIPETRDRLAELMSLTPHSKDQFYQFVKEAPEEQDPVQRAHKWLVVTIQSFGGLRSSFGYSRQGANLARKSSRWATKVPWYADRLLNVTLENRSWEDLFEIYDTPVTVTYADPPYLPEARRGDVYDHEMSYEDHERLIETLMNAKGGVILSGYDNKLYRRLDDTGWVRFEKRQVCSVVGTTRNLEHLRGDGARKEHQMRVEVVWRNPAVVEMARRPASLLDRFQQVKGRELPSEVLTGEETPVLQLPKSRGTVLVKGEEADEGDVSTASA